MGLIILVTASVLRLRRASQVGVPADCLQRVQPLPVPLGAPVHQQQGKQDPIGQLLQIKCAKERVLVQRYPEAIAHLQRTDEIVREGRQDHR